MSKVLEKLEWLYRQTGYIAGALSVIMVIAIMREVVGRYLFDYPSDWSLELSCYLLVGLVYLSGAYTVLVDGHVRIDVIYGRLQGKAKAIADIIISLIAICFCSFLLWQGGLLAWDSLIAHKTSATIMQWPLFPSQVMVPIGAFLSILAFIGKIYYSLNSLRRGED